MVWNVKGSRSHLITVRSLINVSQMHSSCLYPSLLNIAIQFKRDIIHFNLTSIFNCSLHWVFQNRQSHRYRKHVNFPSLPLTVAHFQSDGIGKWWHTPQKIQVKDKENCITHCPEFCMEIYETRFNSMGLISTNSVVEMDQEFELFLISSFIFNAGLIKILFMSQF